MQQIANLDDFVTIEGCQPVTDSRRVAQRFGKPHRTVLRAIRNLDCSATFRVRNFVQTPFVDGQNGQTYDSFVMTKDGFMFLVMGFTGKDAAAMKEAFIEAFNAMAELLRSGLWQRRMDAEAALLTAKDQASVDGRGLRLWQTEKRERTRDIEALDAQIQLSLQLH